MSKISKICISIVITISIIILISGINLYNDYKEDVDYVDKYYNNISDTFDSPYPGDDDYDYHMAKQEKLWEEYNNAEQPVMVDLDDYYNNQLNWAYVLIFFGFIIPIIIIIAIVANYLNERENAKYRTYQMKCPHCGEYFSYRSKHGSLDIGDFGSHDNYNWSGTMKTGTTTYYCPNCNRRF